MQNHGLVKTAVDRLMSVASNADYPGVGHQGLLGLFNELLPYLAGFASGDITGTGAAITVGSDADSDVVDTKIEFDPKLVLVANETNSTFYLSLRSAAGKAWKIKAAGAGSTFELLAADGITLGTRSFTIGAEADLNTADDVIRYVAVGV